MKIVTITDDNISALFNVKSHKMLSVLIVVMGNIIKKYANNDINLMLYILLNYAKVVSKRFGSLEMWVSMSNILLESYRRTDRNMRWCPQAPDDVPVSEILDFQRNKLISANIKDHWSEVERITNDIGELGVMSENCNLYFMSKKNAIAYEYIQKNILVLDMKKTNASLYKDNVTLKYPKLTSTTKLLGSQILLVRKKEGVKKLG